MSHRVGLPAVIEIEWLDSMSFSRWEPDAEKLAHLDEPDVLLHRTSGYLVKETELGISIAQSIGIGAENIGDVMTIPAVAVLKKTVLREAET
jgi:hypothetical protein